MRHSLKLSGTSVIFTLNRKTKVNNVFFCPRNVREALPELPLSEITEGIELRKP